ncbi:MAG: hydrolase [Nitrospirae bacterium GWC2_46_6]|nr:MAG: hydrolase [Nitrospirae bacterium GWA2_46_11]OGW23438.1 MAG: hydrolase [Nitrospirae bacterium GWC2_46_6]OGW23995.1 MAG: hydrolase [Nitrospirae bacterium GWB2_47_37]HAK88855.1 hydrolase [Nitrospiraceae bacterium]HCL81895.1 hydrolase [Nitrospiraceae bacterium]
MDRFYLDKNDVLLLIVDIQERLVPAMKPDVKDAVFKNCGHLIELSKMLNIPTVLTEQYPKGLGPTVNEIKDLLPEYRPIAKLTFSCCEEPDFLREIKKLNKKTIILAGMETHICVLQTCIGLLKEGFNVHLVSDAVCSRAKANWRTAIEFMRDAGAVITCTETVLFQLLKVAGTEEFKTISKRIR